MKIQDDVLEETLSVDIIGKTKSDTIRKKPTYVSILGLNKTKMHILKLENEITKIINKLKLFDSSLYQLILKIYLNSNAMGVFCTTGNQLLNILNFLRI